MSLIRSIKRVASFIKFSTDLKRLKILMKSNPEDISILVPYMREKLRRGDELPQSLMTRYVRLVIESDSELEINNLAIAQEFLKQKYNIEINLSEPTWEFWSKKFDLDWMNNLTAENLGTLKFYSCEIGNTKGLLTFSVSKLKVLIIHGNSIPRILGVSESITSNLEKLSLQGPYKTKNLEWMRGLQLPKAKQINIQLAWIDDLSILGSIQAPNLVGLDLTGHHIENLNELTHLNFPNLQDINLSLGHLKNLDITSPLRLPKIKEINLSNNLIESIKGLPKSIYRKLFLYNNPIRYSDLTDEQKDEYPDINLSGKPPW